MVKESTTLKQVSDEILQIAHNMKYETIYKILAMDEMGLAMAVLSGKIKPLVL
jgi:hypothetical protein